MFIPAPLPPDLSGDEDAGQPPLTTDKKIIFMLQNYLPITNQSHHLVGTPLGSIGCTKVASYFQTGPVAGFCIPRIAHPVGYNFVPNCSRAAAGLAHGTQLVADCAGLVLDRPKSP
jgi:hypothetical protein